MILVIDNYDSFVHNLARYIRLLDCPTQVVRNDEISIAQIQDLNPQAIVLSPGPCTPDQAGICLSVVERLHTQTPILGICLGHQTIVQALGGKVVPAAEPMHGRSSRVHHDSSAMFRQVPNPFSVGRYHSLVGHPKSIPDQLKTTANIDGTIMAVQHLVYPVVGLQFHPESILTESGFQLISNFLTLAGIDHTTDQIAALQIQQFSGFPTISGRPYPLSDRLQINNEE